MCTEKRKKQVETKVSLALRKIKAVGNLVDEYNFTEEEIDKIFNALSDKVKAEKKRMKSSMAVKDQFRQPFSFNN